MTESKLRQAARLLATIRVLSTGDTIFVPHKLFKGTILGGGGGGEEGATLQLF
jgi:hypothetical protein